MHRKRTLTQIAVGAVLAAALLPSAAQAWTRVEGGDPALAALYASWVAGSAVPTADAVVRLDDRACTELDAMTCTNVHQRPMRMMFPDMGYLFDGSDNYTARDRLMVRAMFLHELGHVRDFTPRKTHRYRALFAWVMRYPNAVDEHGNWQNMADWVDPSERFAMAFEWCALDPMNLPAPGDRADELAGYGYNPTLAQHRVVCAMLQRPLR